MSCSPAGILEEDRDERDNNATIMAKYFYQSCMDMGKDKLMAMHNTPFIVKCGSNARPSTHNWTLHILFI